MIRVLIIGVVLAAGGCGVPVVTVVRTAKDNPTVAPAQPQQLEVYDKVAPMPREAKAK